IQGALDDHHTRPEADQKPVADQECYENVESRPNTPNRTRTGVFWLRTRHPRPLDDGGRSGYCAELGGRCQGNRQRIALPIDQVPATLLATNAYRPRIRF